MGLHLGWIPNEPGLRPRAFEQPAPPSPDPDPAKVTALRSAQHVRGLWSGMLILVGLFALALFGFIAAVAHIGWAWDVAVGIAACCWLPVGWLAWNRRRAAAGLRRETEEKFKRHAAEVAEYERGKALWERSEAERVAVAPRWLRVAAQEDTDRLDVFGGTPQGRQNLLSGVGQALLAERAVIVLDLSQDQVGGGLVAGAAAAGISCQDYLLPRDLAETPLLDGLTGDEIASLIVEVVHADDATATAAGRATDLMILKKVNRVLGGDVTMARLHEALAVLLGDGGAGGGAGDGSGDGAGDGTAGSLSEAEHDGLRAILGDGLRREVGGNLVRLVAVLEPLAALGSAAALRSPARLTCLSLPDGPRDVTADLTAALTVQWVTRAVAADSGFRPAIVLAGADEQSTRHLGRLVAVCERYEIPLVRMFSRLTEESARHLDTRHTAFMRLATRPEALRAAEHIGHERRFVAGRFSHRHSVSRSRTRTSGESVTHTSGRTEGEAVTHTTGTITGQSYSEAEVPRHDRDVHVHVHDRADGPGGARQRNGDRDDPHPGESLDGEAPAKGGGRGGDGRQARQDRNVRDGAEKGTGHRDGAGVRDAAGRAGGGGRAAGWGGAGGRRAADAMSGPGAKGANSTGSAKGGAGGKGKRPELDIIKTRTWFTARQESEAKTQSWTKTEETSHTRSQSQSRTDGVSVGDEITYELAYDHKVAPEALMALPEDQMLAPHIVEGASGAGPALAGSKMVALVVDPSVVGSAAVAPVRPDEIPAFQPPTPAISEHVPDYERIPPPAIGAG